MKIPQREDVVGLEAPRTQAGRAVQPVEGSLGDSYITAMRGMSKELNELSSLQFDLAKNAMQGQLNSFDIYVDARTKQYNQELAKATTAEQINDLFGKYQADIANTGTAMLGDKIYDGWFKAKGGTTIAGSNYAANLTQAQLQIKLNNERLDNQGRELNTLAGTASTAEERQKYVDQYDDILRQNVENGTINEAQLQEKKQQFNYQLTTSLVIKSMEDNPLETAKRLRTDKNFAPILTFPDRLRLAEQAERMGIERKGTRASAMLNQTLDLWVPLWQAPAGAGEKSELPYYNEKGQKVGVLHGTYNDIARQTYDIAHKNENELRYVMQALLKQAGANVPLSEISMEDARKFRKEMASDYIGDKESPQYQAFENKDDAIQRNWNTDGIYYKDKKAQKEGKPTSANEIDFVPAFKEGRLVSNLDYNQLIDRTNKLEDMMSDNSTAYYIRRSDGDNRHYRQKYDNYIDAFVYSLQNPKEKRFAPQNEQQVEMQKTIAPFLDQIDSRYSGYDSTTAKRNFMSALMSRADLNKAFDPSDEKNYWQYEKSPFRAGVAEGLFDVGIAQTPVFGMKQNKDLYKGGKTFESILRLKADLDRAKMKTTDIFPEVPEVF